MRLGGSSAIMLLVAVGCAPPAVHTPFLGSSDLMDMTDRMAESFVADPAIGRRRGDSALWVVSIDRVANHTNEVIPSREKWAYVTRLRSQLAQSDIAARRNIMWVIEPERWPLVPDELDEPSPRVPPTHLLAGAFHTLTQTSGRGRSDAYLCAFQLTDLRSGQLVWEDAWEVKRSVLGLTYD